MKTCAFHVILRLRIIHTIMMESIENKEIAAVATLKNEQNWD
jgi:hypothetical protein